MLRRAVTENGIVKGIEAADPRITAFKGIPFAAPPVGENRWRAPQPCENWEGVRECYRFAPIAVQDTPGLGTDIYCREWHVDPDFEMSEDCLYLNVWTPAKSVDEKLPVLVWFYGGALQWGYPSEMEFDGERIARRGVIVVTVNYRINVFGFLAHPDLTKNQPDAPTNFGSLDQQAGINWVNRNIAAFGGDPKNITIAGQSAGGGSVMSQLACPKNEGKFQRAIIESALIRSPYRQPGVGKPRSMEDAYKICMEFFDRLGVKTIEEARKLDAIYIRDEYAKFRTFGNMLGTVQDDQFCIGDPIDLFMRNKQVKVPVLSGNTADEFPNVILANTKEEYEKKAQEIFGEHANEFLSFEEAWKVKDNKYAPVNGIECTIKSMFLRNEKFKNPEKCYYYRFDAEIPGWDHPGTFHSVDLWFFFETLAKCWRPFTGKHYDLSRQMCNYWANFIKSGDPNGNDADGTPMPEWKPYTKENPFDMVFSKDGVVTREGNEPEFKQFLIDRLTEQMDEKNQ